MYLRHILALAFICLSSRVQDGPPINLDHSSPFDALVRDLRGATGGRILLETGVENKNVTVHVKEAGFYQALDALCRAHGGVRYFGIPPIGGPEGLTLFPLPWIDFPSCYSGPYKIALSEMATFSSVTSEGGGKWSRVFLVLFAPPWIAMDRAMGAKVDWVIQEVTDAEGHELLSEDPEPKQRMNLLWHSSFQKGNIATKTLSLRHFDIDRGLRLLKGAAWAIVPENVPLKVALDAGKALEVPGGVLTVEHVRKDAEAWRIGLTLKMSAGRVALRRTFANRFRYGPAGGPERWGDLDLPPSGETFEAVVSPKPAPPVSLTLYVRKGEEQVSIPFEFRDIAFKKP